MTGKSEKFIVADSEEKKDIKNFFKSAINNNHPLLNQFISLLKLLKKILSFLFDIFRVNTLLMLELQLDLANKEDIPKSPNI